MKFVNVTSMSNWEYRPMHGSNGFFGEEAEVLEALEKGCGDAYGPNGEHLTRRCEECEKREQ